MFRREIEILQVQNLAPAKDEDAVLSRVTSTDMLMKTARKLGTLLGEQEKSTDTFT